ncbi:hypothetical protein [Endozoicomonas sp. 8E]|uniref:hypothetical protein n=1 Tax=Endozoicomonas sp. 8E TaxID=3035692 RepID=UPI0029392B28|nr:hypothetical protein [Endozoicomonas sp. 8E]WOG28205.1 hypothetical protein P6910_00730 [Endozoicomonas sp. 8E]
MSHSISRLPETAEQSIFFHRGRANRSVAACLGLIIMVYPHSKLMALHTLLTPVDESFVREKTTKASNYLNDLINHNAYSGKTTPFFLNPNTTQLIFAMNHENELVEKMAAHSEESEGAGALQPQPLMEIPLPPMTHAQITAIIQNLHTSTVERRQILNTILSCLPVTPPNESLTIAGMIQHVREALAVVPDDSQNEIIKALYSIRGYQSPVDMTQPKDKFMLAILLVTYYTAINSNAVSPKVANIFFNSFLLHAITLSGIERLDAIKGDLLGVKEPIKDYEVLKANVKESATVFTGQSILEEMRLGFLQQHENLSEIEKSEKPVNRPLLAASTLLNYGMTDNGMPLYQRNMISANRMLKLIAEYGEKKPELVASNSQFINFINAINLMLDPYVIQSASEYINNMTDYFCQSNWDQSITNAEGKEQRLFEVFKKILSDAEDNPGNENPELFQELLLAIEKYIEQKLQKTFTDQNDYQVIMVTLCTGFDDLLVQSNRMLTFLERNIFINANRHANECKHGKAAKGQEESQLSKEERQKKHLEERISYLRDFVDMLRSKYDFAMKTPHNSVTSDSDSGDSHISDPDRSDSGRTDSGISAPGSSDSDSCDAVMDDPESSDAERGALESLDEVYF